MVPYDGGFYNEAKNEYRDDLRSPLILKFLERHSKSA